MGVGATPHSVARSILQRSAKAEAERPLRVIVVDRDAPSAVSTNLKGVTLAEAAGHLVVVEAREHEDLHGENVVSIPKGQEKHPLYENAESRRRSRMLG